MGKPPVTKGQAGTGIGVRDLLAATQLLYVCHLWVMQTIRKVWSVVYPGIPFAAYKLGIICALPGALLRCFLEVELLLLALGCIDFGPRSLLDSGIVALVHQPSSP